MAFKRSKKKSKEKQKKTKGQKELDKLLELREKVNAEAERIVNRIDKGEKIKYMNLDRLEELSAKYEKLEREIEKKAKEVNGNKKS